MNKYKISLLLGTLFLFSFVRGQQEVLYTQYVFSQLSVNPAYAGNEDGLSLTALTRKQWFGLKGSPTSFSFMGHANIMNNKTECRNFANGSDKRKLEPARSTQVGLGLVIFSDQVGVDNTFLTSFAYSYKIQFRPGTRLSFGLQGTMLNYYQSFSKLDNQSPDDPVFQDNTQVSKFNVGTGIFYESYLYYIGLSIPELMSNKISQGDFTKQLQLRQYFLTGGYVFYLTHVYKFEPTVMMRYTEGLPAQFDVTANFLYRDKLWAGLSYRYTNSLAMLFKVCISDVFRVGMAYDYPINEVGKVTHGSAEIMINYIFQKAKKRVINPRYF